MKKLFSISSAALLALPLVTFAQFNDVDTFVRDLGALINGTLIPVLLAIAFLVFIIGAVRFFLIAGDEYDDNKKKGKALMLYGIIAFVLIVSVWGIVRLFATGLDLNDDTLQNVPSGPITR